MDHTSLPVGGWVYIFFCFCIAMPCAFVRRLTCPWLLSYGDTAMIAGVGHGVILGAHLNALTDNVPLPWLHGALR